MIELSVIAISDNFKLLRLVGHSQIENFLTYISRVLPFLDRTVYPFENFFINFFSKKWGQLSTIYPNIDT